VPVREVGLAVRQPRRPRRLVLPCESRSPPRSPGDTGRVGEASRVGGRWWALP